MIRKTYDSILKQFYKFYWVFFAAACLVLALFCFYHLDVKYVDSWDEARHGVNAYEMIQNGNYIQHTYNYEVEDWNLKPSMSYWGIILGFQLFGYTVFGLRFYSALAYLLTGIVSALFVKRYTKVGALILLGLFCSNTLPLYAHLARAGDADSLFLFFFTAAMLAMLSIPRNRKYLYLCGLCFALAFLTKSWHAGMIAAIGGIYLLSTGELFRIRRKEWGIFLASAVGPLLLWFGWRYTADGFTFLKQMIQTDLLARTGTSDFEDHGAPFSFYYQYVFGNELYIYRWCMLICLLGVVGLLINHWYRKRKLTTEILPEISRESLPESLPEISPEIGPEGRHELIIGLVLWFGITFFGFSLMETKLIWYIYPAIIPLFVATALFLGGILEKKERPEILGACQWILVVASVCLLAYFMRDTYRTAIQSAQGAGFQDFISESIDRDSTYAGQKAYIMVMGEHEEDLGMWDQNVLFLAEISGDYHCTDGGVEAFLEETESCILYIDRERYNRYQEELAGYEAVYATEEYMMFQR